jgi:predicted helicase
MATLTQCLRGIDKKAKHKREKGRLFEEASKWFFPKSEVHGRGLKHIWLWDEWPEKYGRETGIDLVAEQDDGRLWMTQAKCFNSKTRLGKNHVDSLVTKSRVKHIRDRVARRICIITTNAVTSEAKAICISENVQIIDRDALEAEDLNWPESGLKQPTVAKERDQLLPHQREACVRILEACKTEDRVQVHMACGSGKTLVGIRTIDDLDPDLTLVLVPTLNLLSQTRDIWCKQSARKWNYIVLCSDKSVIDSDKHQEYDMNHDSRSALSLVDCDSKKDIEIFLRTKGGKVIFWVCQIVCVTDYCVGILPSNRMAN